MPKLTKRTVDAASVEPERHIIWDTELKGFGLLVLPTGIKSFVYQYRTMRGVKRRITLGKANELTAEQARRKAEELRYEVRQEGKDPLQQRQDERKAATVNELLDHYLNSEAFKDKATLTQQYDAGRIDRHLRPLLGKRHAADLTQEDIKKALRDITEGKTAVHSVTPGKKGRVDVKGGRGAAKMSIDLLRAVFNWGIEQKLAKHNPCIGVKTGSSNQREAILESAEDYGTLFSTLDRLERERRIPSAAADAIRVIAMTGARRGEITSLVWKHIDLKRGTITLPPTHHKTGKRTGKPRVITLPAAAQAVIARQPFAGDDGNVFVFTKGEAGPYLSQLWNRVIRKAAGFRTDLTLHCLRHSVASHLAMAGAGSAEIMSVLGHKQLATTGRYLHFAETAQQALAERAAKVAMVGMTVAKKGAA